MRCGKVGGGSLASDQAGSISRPRLLEVKCSVRGGSKDTGPSVIHMHMSGHLFDNMRLALA